MRSVVKTGKTVDDAIKLALQALDNAKMDDVTVEILEQPKAGFLGMFGGKEAIVRVTRKETTDFQEMLREEGLFDAKGETRSEAPKAAAAHLDESSVARQQKRGVERVAESAHKSANKTEAQEDPKVAASVATEPLHDPTNTQAQKSSAAVSPALKSTRKFEENQSGKTQGVKKEVAADEEASQPKVEAAKTPEVKASESQGTEPQAVTASTSDVKKAQPKVEKAKAKVEPVAYAPIPRQQTVHQTPQEPVAQKKTAQESASKANESTTQHAASPLNLSDLIRQQVGESPKTETEKAPVERVEASENAEDASETTPQEVAAEGVQTAVEASEVQVAESAPAHDHKNITTDDEAVQFCRDWLSQTLEMMHIEADIESSVEGDNINLELVNITDTDMGIVIGRRAETLNAIQYLCGVSLNRSSKRHYRVYLDVGGYRSRRKQNITMLAERNAEKAIRYQKAMKLEPMNAYERHIVHTALQGHEHIETISEGREPHRRVVIVYKD